MSETAAAGEAPHQCDNCFKTYQRRDLLLRHRRRCLRSNKPATRQKACHACVQAKAKCCYSHPVCTRCAKRAISCEYVTTVTPPASMSAAGSVDDARLPSKPRHARSHTTDSAASSSGCSPTGAGSVADNMDSSWGSQTFPWSFDVLDLPSLHSSTLVNLESAPGSLTYPPHTFNLASPPLAAAPYGPLNGDSATPAYPGISGPSSIAALQVLSLAPSPPNGQLPDGPAVPLASNCLRLLVQYPRLLLQDDFYCPFLHRILFNEHVPDMTVLPHTSMAICCGTGLAVKEGARYIRRAMDAQRQSLIEAYPTYHCMEQWDALHAMLVYEVLELGVPPVDDCDSWKRKSRPNGLKSPFLSKMTQCFSRSYLETHDTTLMPPADTNTSWNQWAVTETARRTIFLANITNFFSNRNHKSGQQSPYYEPLNDDLILSLPLPCSHALWSARTEEEWRTALHLETSNCSLAAFSPSPGSEVLDGEHLLNDPSQLSLKFLFSKFTKDYLRSHLGLKAGLSDSNELRSFIILCALEQFA